MNTKSVSVVRRQQSAGTFSQEQWHSIATQISAAFRMTQEEGARFENRKIAKLIAAIPFLAGCSNPERTALSHLATYVLAATSSRVIFDHSYQDDSDVFARLELISNFAGGNAEIIRRGMNLLALSMVSGYVRDLEKDAASGEYNPVLSGIWDADAISEGLQKEIQATPCDRMDGIVTKHEVVLGSWWG